MESNNFSEKGVGLLCEILVKMDFIGEEITNMYIGKMKGECLKAGMDKKEVDSIESFEEILEKSRKNEAACKIVASLLQKLERVYRSTINVREEYCDLIAEVTGESSPFDTNGDVFINNLYKFAASYLLSERGQIDDDCNDLPKEENITWN